MSIDLSFITPIIHVLFTGICNIYETVPVVDKRSGISRGSEEKLVYEEIPCQLSHSSLTPSESSPFPEATQQIKIFLDPDIEVKPGSRIEITQNEETAVYYATSQANRFDSHKEIALSRERIDI